MAHDQHQRKVQTVIHYLWYIERRHYKNIRPRDNPIFRSVASLLYYIKEKHTDRATPNCFPFWRSRSREHHQRARKKNASTRGVVGHARWMRVIKHLFGYIKREVCVLEAVAAVRDELSGGRWMKVVFKKCKIAAKVTQDKTALSKAQPKILFCTSIFIF